MKSAIAIPLVAALTSLQASAAAWEFNPSVEAGYLFDDNYRLSTPGTEIEVQGPVVDAELELRTLTPKGEFSFTPRVRATYFPDASDLDAVDYFGTLNWLHRGQRVETRVRGEFAAQDVVNSEQPSVDAGGELGEPDLGESGRVLVENRRMRASLRPSMSMELSPRRSLQFDAGYVDVSFDDQIAAAQVDYNVADLAAGLVTRLNERSSLITRLRGARYDIDTLEATNAYGAEVEWSTTTAAETRRYLRVGAQNVELQSGDSEVAWIAGAGVSFLLGRNELFTDLSRNVGPSSAGAVVTRDQLRLRFTRAMTPRLSLLAGLLGNHDDAVDSASGFGARSYATGDVGLQWRWQEEFSLRVAFDYTWQEFRSDLEDATSSGAMVSILYQPLQRRR
ncbi:MAG TPA: hypothetical protein VGO61_12755 [Steroidobacteraceae bacterium]|jgi:hypothetical protein|nr:hypothetical protein [Steroidobacteraceae bacterium]